MDNKKQNLGQFNTKNDVWLRPHIADFIINSGCDVVVDPYAGRGDLIHATKQWFDGYAGYDIDPDLCTDMGWTWMDSLEYMPRHENGIVITNPPYLAKNSAARNNLESYDYFKDPDNEKCEDLYQIAIRKVLEKYKKAVFIIPETYFQTELFKGYLHSYTVIEENPFTDTDCPVCVVCFNVHNDLLSIHYNNYKIYRNDSYLYDRFELTDILYQFNTGRSNTKITFNDPDGNLGLRAIDGISLEDRICFAKPEDLNYDLKNIKESSRSITLINIEGVDVNDNFIKRANYFLDMLRLLTNDIVLSPFKNNNKFGVRRRRLDYEWARKILEKTMEALDK
jgi:hypothetical protein